MHTTGYIIRTQILDPHLLTNTLHSHLLKWTPFFPINLLGLFEEEMEETLKNI